MQRDIYLATIHIYKYVLCTVVCMWNSGVLVGPV